MSVDFEIKNNEDWVLDIQLLDENKLPVTDLIGATAVLQIKGKLADASPLIAVNGYINSGNATAQFTVNDTQIGSLLADGDMRRSLVYGVRISYVDGIDEAPLQGRLKITRGVIV